jgi:hypothetical protein
VTDPNDWGWGSDEELVETGPPKVDVAELLVEDGDLPRLESDLRKIVARGKNHVSLRLHFTRPMTSEDVQALSACRDYLASQNGQLLLLSLPHEILKWLRMLEFDREFLIVETAEEADLAHRRHAAGEQPIVSVPEEGPFVIVGEEGSAFVLRPRELRDRSSVRRASLQVPRIVPGSDALGELPGRLGKLERGSGVLVDLTHAEEVEGKRFEPLETAASLARQNGLALVFANATHEVKALVMGVLGIEAELELSLERAVLNLAAQIHAKSRFEELRLDLIWEDLHAEPVSSVELGSAISLGTEEPAAAATAAELEELRAHAAKALGEAGRYRDEVSGLRRRLHDVEQERNRAEQRGQELQATVLRDERRLLELEQEKGRAEVRAAQAETARETFRADVQRLEAELSRLRQDLDSARSASTAGDARRVQELEKKLQERDERIALLEAEARQAADTDVRALRKRLAELEEKNARILTEAEAEIQRLTTEQTILTEELANAGEMIERLGKELELSS